MLQNSLDSIKNNFFDYLTNLGLSAKSHKNYRSDLSHFSGWVILKIRSFGSYIDSLTEAVPFLNQDIAKEYKSFMHENKIPVKTINRRLSTLRHLSRFLTSIEAMEKDFMTEVENISESNKRKVKATPVIEGFRSYLVAEKISKNTIKNYLSDINQFMSWVEANQQINNTTN